MAADGPHLAAAVITQADPAARTVANANRSRPVDVAYAFCEYELSPSILSLRRIKRASGVRVSSAGSARWMDPSAIRICLPNSHAWPFEGSGE